MGRRKLDVTKVRTSITLDPGVLERSRKHLDEKERSLSSLIEELLSKHLEDCGGVCGE